MYIRHEIALFFIFFYSVLCINKNSVVFSLSWSEIGKGNCLNLWPSQDNRYILCGWKENSKKKTQRAGKQNETENGQIVPRRRSSYIYTCIVCKLSINVKALRGFHNHSQYIPNGDLERYPNTKHVQDGKTKKKKGKTFFSFSFLYNILTFNRTTTTYKTPQQVSSREKKHENRDPRLFMLI